MPMVMMLLVVGKHPNIVYHW